MPLASAWLSLPARYAGLRNRMGPSRSRGGATAAAAALCRLFGVEEKTIGGAGAAGRRDRLGWPGFRGRLRARAAAPWRRRGGGSMSILAQEAPDIGKTVRSRSLHCLDLGEHSGKDLRNWVEVWNLERFSNRGGREIRRNFDYEELVGIEKFRTELNDATGFY